MTKVRVVLADDHAVIRAGLRMLVDAQPDMECVGEAADGAEAVARVRELEPDVAVLDISMPVWNGLEATERIRECCPNVKLLTLTRHADEGFLLRLLKAGVSGYVLKQSATDILLAGIRAVAAGGSFLDPAVTTSVIGAVSRANPKGGETAAPGLSDRECEVLRLIAWGYSNKEIGARLEISVKTVEAHKANAMRRLGMKGRVDVVRYALLQGWLKES